jgi:hypothetical protein
MMKITTLDVYKKSDFFDNTETHGEVQNFFSKVDVENIKIRLQTVLALEVEPTAEQFSDVSRAFQEAKVFHEAVLRLNLPEEILSFRLDSPESLYQLLLLAFDDESSFGPIVVALLKICLSILQAKLNSFHHFDMSMLYLMDSLLETLGLVQISKDGFSLDDNGETKVVTIRTRAKKFERTIVKLLKSKCFNPECVEDGLGIRILVDNTDDLIYFVERVYRTFFDYSCPVTEIRANNFNFLSSEGVRVLSEMCPDLNMESYCNPQAAGNFHAFFLLGVMNTPTSTVPFEVQFNKSSVDLDEGMAHHEIYEFKQRLAALTNLYGYFSMVYLLEEIAKLSISTNRSVDEILLHLIEESIVELKPAHGGRRFASKAQFEILEGEGLVPEGVFAF